MSENVWTLEKNILMVENTFFHVSRGLSERKIFVKIFFLKKWFRTLREKFPDLCRTFDRQGLENSIFLPEETCDEEQFFFQMNKITIKKILTTFREFFWSFGEKN